MGCQSKAGGRVGRQPSFTGTLLEAIMLQSPSQPALQLTCTLQKHPSGHSHTPTPTKNTHNPLPLTFFIYFLGLNRRKPAFAANERSRGVGNSGPGRPACRAVCVRVNSMCSCSSCDGVYLWFFTPSATCSYVHLAYLEKRVSNEESWQRVKLARAPSVREVSRRGLRCSWH